MSTIHEPNDQFSFDLLKLSKPVASSGGGHFIRFSVNNNAVYIQPPKCKTKQGFLKTGKRYYTDLIFTNDNDEFIRWMENLESQCHSTLYANRDKWFEDAMELHDIENYFTSPMKIYKTGKYYIVRVNVQTNLGVPALTIYDEDNNEIMINKVDDKQDVMTILEIKGIKCTSTSFQIEIDMKQMLIVKPVELFTKCIIKSPNMLNKPSTNDTSVAHDNEPVSLIAAAPEITDKNENESQPNSIEPDCILAEPDDINLVITTTDPIVEVEPPIETDITPIEVFVENEPDVKSVADSTNVTNEVMDDNISIDTTTNNIGLEEVELNLDNLTDVSGEVIIKQKNEVYYQMYREACRKAKIARDLALSSYLEAKRIKNTYMLEDLSDSDESDLEHETAIE